MCFAGEVFVCVSCRYVCAGCNALIVIMTGRGDWGEGCTMGKCVTGEHEAGV